MVPEPAPVGTTVNWNCCGGRAVNVAVAEESAFIVMAQVVPAPVQLPLQVVKLNPLFGASVSVTCVPAVNVAVQVCGQLMPAGMLLTAPFATFVRDN